MRICFVAPANNYHTQKWCKWFSERGHEIHVISFVKAALETAVVHFIDAGVKTEDKDLQKLKYLFTGKQIKKIIRNINPDIVSVHYATSYGAAAALSGLRGYILSIWGTDIYGFPKKSFLHKMLLIYSLRKAQYIFSTSKAMADEAHKYTNNKIEITPFGVDTNLFHPSKRRRKNEQNDFIIGTVKTLAPKYGIEYLLKAAAIIKNEYPNISLKLRIAGKGSHEKEYKELSAKLGIEDITVWLGFISQEKAAEEWANMDIAVVASESESFGVSAVEAQACGTAVIISDIPGLMEATSPGVTSVIVKRKNERAIADAVIELYRNTQKRIEMGNCGVKFVCENYSLDMCFEKIEALFIKYCEK